MGGTECIVYIHIGQCGQLSAELRIIVCLSFMIAQILKEQNLARLQCISCLDVMEETTCIRI